MDCVLCHEPITNPLCTDCLGKATEEWMQEQDPERLEDLQQLNESFSNPPLGINCIRCHQHMIVCTYCYTREVFNWLREGTLQIEYLKTFNFLSQT